MVIIYTICFNFERRLRVVENRVLRRIFGPKRDEETGRWRNLHNEELHNVAVQEFSDFWYLNIMPASHKLVILLMQRLEILGT
jgi:hypothetical protein